MTRVALRPPRRSRPRVPGRRKVRGAVRRLAMLFGGVALAAGCGASAAGPATQPGGLTEDRLGLTRQVSQTVTAACRVAARDYSGTMFCPPLVPEGPAKLGLKPGPVDRRTRAQRRSSFLLDFASSSLERLHGRRIDANGGHWTFAGGTGTALDGLIRQWLDDESTKRRTQRIAGRRTTIIFMPSFRAGGGYYGGHVVAIWRSGEYTYHLSVHGHANLPRLTAMSAAVIQLQTDAHNVRPARCAPQCPDETCRPLSTLDPSSLSGLLDHGVRSP